VYHLPVLTYDAAIERSWNCCLRWLSLCCDHCKVHGEMKL